MSLQSRVEIVETALSIYYPDYHIARDWNNGFVVEFRYDCVKLQYTDDLYFTTTDGTNIMNVRTSPTQVLEFYPSIDEFPECDVKKHIEDPILFKPYVSTPSTPDQWTHIYGVRSTESDLFKDQMDENCSHMILRTDKDLQLDRIYLYYKFKEYFPNRISIGQNADYRINYVDPWEKKHLAVLEGYSPYNSRYRHHTAHFFKHFD